jgi:hypothetical protein
MRGAGLSTYPLFCQQQWFYPGNASALRGHIRAVLLRLFVEQVPPQRREGLDALAHAAAELQEYEENTGISRHAQDLSLCSDLYFVAPSHGSYPILTINSIVTIDMLQQSGVQIVDASNLALSYTPSCDCCLKSGGTPEDETHHVHSLQVHAAGRT